MLPARWKLFRVICILQVVLTGLSAGFAFIRFLFTGSAFELLNTVAFTAMALFASLGISLIHNNYPDILLAGSQKKYFNILYITNFLLVSFAGAHVYVESWIVMFLLEYKGPFTYFLLLGFELFLAIFILFLHIAILYGMFRFRRELYANYIRLVEEIAPEVK